VVVLVIEDSATMRRLLCEAVQRIAGAIAIEATDGADALAKLAEVHPDLILTDINMPAMDGFTFLARLRELADHRATPVIVLTTEGADEDRERALALGVTAYVTKPIRGQDIVATIERIAGARSPTPRPTPPSQPPPPAPEVVVLHVDYDDAADLVADYETTLARGEIVVSNRRELPAGTAVRLVLQFPGLAVPIQLDGVVRSASATTEPTLAITLADGAQREQLARAIAAIVAAARS
jgi:two-component system chemotaxis response regulator CheY